MFLCVRQDSERLQDLLPPPPPPRKPPPLRPGREKISCPVRALNEIRLENSPILFPDKFAAAMEAERRTATAKNANKDDEEEEEDDIVAPPLRSGLPSATK